MSFSLFTRGAFVAAVASLLLFVAMPSQAAPKSSGTLTVNPTGVSFGTLNLNTSASKSITMQNTSTASMTVSSGSFSAGGFSTSGLVLPLTLAPGQSSIFQVIYAPTVAGTNSATLSLKKSNGAVLASVAMSGSGVAPLDTTAPSVSIASPGNGATLSGTVTLSANASDNVGVARVQFYVNGTAIGPQVTAAPYSVAWNTTGVSNGTGYVINALAWDAAGNQTTSAGVSTSVSNVAPIQHAASLSWAASASSIAGYYVYRATQPGGPYTRVTSSPDAATLFTDSTVSGGQTYYYVVTAVDVNGVESGYSNQTTAQIPQ